MKLSNEDFKRMLLTFLMLCEYIALLESINS